MANRRTPEEIAEILQANLDNIEKWTADGLTQKQIAENLGISEKTFIRYKNKENSPLGKDIKKSIAAGRPEAVKHLENTIFTTATGYERVVKKYVKVKRCIYENGKKADEWEELKEVDEVVYFPPDTTALIFLLKNWGNYKNEPAALELRKKEIELREKQVDATVW